MDITDVNNDGIGLDGMDPVAHYEGEPLQGKDHINYEVFGITYLFDNEKNMERFQENPEKYIPHLGGYMSKGHEDNELHAEDADRRPHPDKPHFHNRRELEDNIETRKKEVTTDMKQNGSVEMQNLHDDNN